MIFENSKMKWILVLVSMFIMSGAFSQTDEEMINKACMNYAEGWYSADTVKISQALAPELSKVGFMISHKTNKLMKMQATFGNMKEWASKKPNEMKTQPDMKFEVQIIETGKNIAMAKVVSPQFIDYVLLGKYDGEWKIYNVIWEPK